MSDVTAHEPHRLGATYLGEDHTRFECWAPQASNIEVVLDDRVVPLEARAHGLHGATIPDVPPGSRYRYRLHRPDGDPLDRPDPASRWQPDGVHGPSAVDDPGAFAWTDQTFRSPPLLRQVLYELHVGTFSPEGTFDGVIDRLPHLVELGITSIELLPVWQFPGGRNWGYDGVLPSAVQNTYGGPDGLRRLVDAAHAVGIGVILDVVHNHLGPEGNYLGDFGPYTTDRYTSPWGPAMNVDGPGADHVRRWIVESVVGFVRDHHIDGFRLDAVHGIIDQSAVHLLEELTTAAKAEGARQGRTVHIIAESDLCDPKLIRPVDEHGYGLDGQWADDFHHAVHVGLTGEGDGYYVDYAGLSDLAAMLRDRYVFAGRYSPYRERTVGRPAPDVFYDRFVVCVQNHDQVGNRMLGERLSALVAADGQRFAAAMLLTSPFVPMLFMGEEYAEPAPFQYFVSHGDDHLRTAVREGRRAEFAAFAWQGEAPDPNDPATFERSRIEVGLAQQPGEHAAMFAFHRHLIELRRDLPLLADPTAADPVATTVPDRQAIAWQRHGSGEAVIVAANADEDAITLDVTDAPGPWTMRFDSSDPRWGGVGPATPPVEQGSTLQLTLPGRTVVVLHTQRPEESA
jgi:maltooligosyltrehalose trehalohydrolase